MPDTVTTRYSALAPQDMLDEIFLKDAREPQDERLWVPSGPGRWNRPLCLNVSQGYWVHLIKVTQAGVVSRHRHPAPVHGFVLEGRWRYLEQRSLDLGKKDRSSIYGGFHIYEYAR